MARCNFYEYERKLQHKLFDENITDDVISMNMKGNYNMRTERDLILCDVIPINMKGNYNEHIGQIGICDDVIPINMKENYNK